MQKKLNINEGVLRKDLRENGISTENKFYIRNKEKYENLKIKIIEDYKIGLTLKGLAKKYNLSEITLGRYFRKWTKDLGKISDPRPQYRMVLGKRKTK